MVSVATACNSALTATSSTNRSKMLAASSPVSILKSSKTAGTKRKMDEIDLGMSPSSPTSDGFNDDSAPNRKRTRVTFDDKNIQMHEAPLGEVDSSNTGKSVGVVREEVRRAIHRHVNAGDSEAYDRVKEIFTVDPKKADDAMYSYDLPAHTTLRHHLLGLLSHVASLDRDCSGLVHAIINSEWLGRDESYVKLYVRFLGNLAAAQGTYLSVIFKMLVTTLAGVSRGTGRLPGYPVVPVSEIYSRVHMALRYLMRLLPAGSSTLSPILSHQFPFDTDPAKSYIAYTRNLIQIISYAPELQSDILALITEKLVKVDVQIQVDLEDFEDELEDEILNVSPDGEEELDDDDASVMSEDEDDDNRRVSEIKGNIHKVDGMIDVLFEYYSPPFTNGSLDDKENALDLLLSHFQTIILPTYKSRHSQFLLFHFSQSSPVLVDRFASACVQLIFNKLQPGIMRQSAAAYLASFVARGAHIPGEVVRDVFDLLIVHLNNLRMDYEPSCRGPDLRRYGPFYSTAQALLYIFCFRWRDLTTAAIEGDSPEQVEELEPSQVGFPPNIKEFLHKAIYSRLNPLKICSPGIVTEFARIAHHFQLLYVYPLLETNKRLRITAFRSISALSNTNFGQVEREIRAGDQLGYQLDAYFPFDPYQLPRSRRWLEGDYVEWRGVPGLDDEGDSDSGADDDGEDDDEDATGTDEE
jgi:RNA polymerase I-specific transcription initiation factor RRN3